MPFRPNEPPIALASDRDPWDRQPGESLKRFEQFQAFMKAGPKGRLAKTAETLTLSPSYVRHVSVHFRWQDRLGAFVENQAREDEAHTAEARRRVAETHVRLGTAMLVKVGQRLATLKPEAMSVTELVRMADVAVKMQQAGLGLPGSTVAVVGDPAQPVAHEDVTGMSFDERRTMYDRVIAELHRRRGLFDAERRSGGQDADADGDGEDGDGGDDAAGA